MVLDNYSSFFLLDQVFFHVATVNNNVKESFDHECCSILEKPAQYSRASTYSYMILYDGIIV